LTHKQNVEKRCIILDNSCYLAFEDFLCKKRGNIPELETVWENRKVVLFIVHEVLGLTEDEFASIYSTSNNSAFRLQKYISKMVSLLREQDKMDPFFCEKSKEQVLATLYPHRNVNSKIDMVHKLNNNDEHVIHYLMKIKDVKRKNIVMHYYLNWLLKNVFQLKSKGEIFDFLLKAEQLKLADYIPALAVIYQNYCCLLDFYFLGLSSDMKKRDFPYYMHRRIQIPEHLDVFVKLGLLKKRQPKVS